MKNIYLTLLIFCAPIICAQNIRQSANIRPVLPSTKPCIIDEVSVKGTVQEQFPQLDTVYALSFVKKNGWLLPLCEITYEQSKHRAQTIRFTHKNRYGHWTKVELINAYGGYAKGLATPYILKNGEEDNAANKEWKKKIEETCIVEIVSDPTGKNVIQERVYDDKHNIVYVFSHTPIGFDEFGRNQYIGAYKDVYGFPAEMRESSEFAYGTIVKITEDEWGYDHIIEYLDSKGLNKFNADSAYKSIHTYDKYGHELAFGSLDKNGNYVIDSWGNCGVEYTWNDDHTYSSCMYTDANWKPIRMPSAKAKAHTGVIKILYEYDKYKRCVGERFVDENNIPMTNIYGTHRIEYKFDSRGNMVVCSGYDLNQQLSPIHISGMAIEKDSFNSDGEIVDAIFLDKHGNPCSTIGYLSRIHWEYDSKGNKILEECYSSEMGEEKLVSKEEIGVDYKYTLWNDGSSRIDSLDNKGRFTFVGFYNKDGGLENVSGRAYTRYKYIDTKGRTISEEIDYDENGNMVNVNGVSRRITVVDSVNRVVQRYHYNMLNELRETYAHLLDSKLDWPIAEYDMNRFGIICRAGGTAGVRHYVADVVYNQKHDFATLVGRDEFNEPDYITSDAGYIYYYQKLSAKGKNIFYSEKNEQITNFQYLRDSLPKVMSIEVIDSIAYKLGLKDNDVILSYGDYAVDLDTTYTYRKFKQDWTLRSVIDARNDKSMIVFRVTDASKNEYGLYKIDGLKGTCSELGFIPHIRYLTDRQTKRIKKTIHDEIKKPHPIVTPSDLKKINNHVGKNYVIFAYTEMYRSNRDKPYATQVNDPAILLGACIKDRKMTWSKHDVDNAKPFETMLSSRNSNAVKYPVQDFFLTRDGITITHLILNEKAVWTNWADTYISDKDYETLIQLYDNASDSIKYILKNNTSIKQKSLCGNWRMLTYDSLRYQPEANLKFAKDGTYDATVVNYGTISYSEGTCVYRIEKRTTGKWNDGGTWVFFYPVHDEENIACVDLQGTDDEDLKQRVLTYMNSICESNKENILKQIEYIGNEFKGDLDIKSITKNSFEAQCSSGSEVSFIRIMEPKKKKSTHGKADVTPKS